LAARSERCGAGPAPRLLLALAAGVAGCHQTPPSWDQLVARKIGEQYPHYRVLPAGDGALTVQRPGLPAQPVDVAAIARFCQRGPRDCDYALDQLLLELAPSAAPAQSQPAAAASAASSASSGAR